MTILPVQAESRGLSALSSLHMTNMPADSECARGLFRESPRPQERAGTVRGTERVISPAHCIGALRGSALFEGVAGDSAAAPGQGKAFPSSNILNCGSCRKCKKLMSLTVKCYRPIRD